jgi:hypothetical protein
MVQTERVREQQCWAEKMMSRISQRALIAITGFACAFPAFMIFNYWSHWLYEQTVVSYEEGFNAFVFREKIGLHVITALVAFTAALIYRPTWRVGIYSGITGALMFRLIDIWTYSLLSSHWLEYRGFFTPLLSAIFIGSSCGILVVSRQVQWRELWQQRGRCLHNLLAMMISGFIALVAVFAVMELILTISWDNVKFNGSIADMVVQLACFGLVGIPVFGFLYSYLRVPTFRPNLLKQKSKPNTSWRTNRP